jgi:hypothetical protein
MRLIWHFLKRILRYNLILSASAVALSWWGDRSFTTGDLRTISLEFSIRFMLIACTAGYAISVFIYMQFYRNELPVYTNGGLHLTKAIAVTWGCLSGALLLAIAIVFFIRRLAYDSIFHRQYDDCVRLVPRALRLAD